MPFSTDGVYTIKNIARDLMLDLKEADTTEGNQVHGLVRDDTADQQQWIIKRHYVSGSSSKIFTIQSFINGTNGNGFFAAANQDSDEPIVYTTQAFIVELVPRADSTYTIRYTVGDDNLVLSIPSPRRGEVKLETYVPGTPHQQWQLTRVSDLQSFA
ncbi:uncharacterized protein F5147DRAFT_670599 [Suillus discolor]|uniref:Ricin B lectin domain-containing protein n=1 Tax=Suillus discolor TaxID=1912936 RepID=A0A9P7FHA3_9AGAM|nr:uncharacterized protein F5147DRAFT_261278 [Suillus discolor]XP_041298746.1 uncharacterized protein F5147DRAFT_670599 [Suillus discolor]KAG2118228.1 hypothetical protein F5147DRAFT_261278 [Suillus discolor]KAG2118229.1 hypothetical protein F5147DRAFT_670599 [Suillus discolor]